MLIRLYSAVLLVCLCAVPAYGAGPSGGVVSAGSATTTQAAAQTIIKQSSDKAVINWGNFSIGSGSTVRFVQPSASSIALNRVTGSQASVIQGALQANGQVWVLNPNGVLIAPSGQVAAGSFLATTRSLTDQQFMAGNYAFTDGGVSGASVVNQGSIIVTEGGYAVLAGEAVRNEGYIEANLGQVVLGGAKAFTLDLSGDNTLAFVVTAPVDVTPTDGKAVVDNSGAIQAAGGRVLMTARAASQVVGQVINTGGVVAATSAQMVNGKIVLDGGAGSVSVAGELNASGKGAAQTGGAIDVNAQKIQIKATAKFDVSGDAGGGKIAIGGGGPNTRTQSFTPAVSTTIAAGARFDASALARGNGGEIVVFTSLTNALAFTQVAGSLIARGGAQGGNGGFVETSGYRLDVGGIVVNTLAPKGRTGLWLLDPTDIFIESTGATSTLGGTPSCDITSGLTNCSKILVDNLNTQLGLSDVTLTATKSITVNGDISWSGPNSLTLATTTSGGSISVNNSIIHLLDEFANITMQASAITISRQVTTTGSITLKGFGPAPAPPAPVSVADSVAIAVGGSLSASLVNVFARDVSVNGSITATTGEVKIESASTVGINALIDSADGISVVASGSIRVGVGAGLNNFTNEITLDAGTIVFNTAISTNSTTNLFASTISFGSGVGSFQVNAIGTQLVIGAPLGTTTTTLTASSSVLLKGEEIVLNTPLAWGGFQLKLEAADGKPISVVGNVTGSGGASLNIVAGTLNNSGGAITLNGTTPSNPSVFTYQGAQSLTGFYGVGEGVGGPPGVSVTVTNTADAAGGGGDTPVVVSPVVPASNTAAVAAAAKAAADAATAKAAADAATAKALADAATAKALADAATAKALADAATAKALADAATAKAAAKVVIDQALNQAIATVVASTSAAVFVAPAPAPLATTPSSSASSTTSTSSTSSSSSASTTTASTTTAATTTTTGESSAGQRSVVTQEFVEPLSVTTLSSTASTVSDPGDTSAATTSANSGPVSQTATPASTADGAPAAPSLTPVAVSKDGADAADFTLQTVKPPAPVTTAKQEARSTERVTTTPVSPGISLQATQKTPAPSGSVLGREISGSGNSSNW